MIASDYKNRRKLGFTCTSENATGDWPGLGLGVGAHGRDGDCPVFSHESGGCGEKRRWEDHRTESGGGEGMMSPPLLPLFFASPGRGCHPWHGRPRVKQSSAVLRSGPTCRNCSGRDVAWSVAVAAVRRFCGRRGLHVFIKKPRVAAPSTFG